MIFHFSFKVRFFSVFGAVKIPKMDFFSIYNYACAKLVFTRAPLNAKYPGSIVFMGDPLIMQILTHSGFAKICYAVVSRVAVDMIDKLIRELSVNVQPGKAVSFVSSVADNDVATTFRSACSSNITNLCPSTGYPPNKIPSIWVVIKKFAQAFRRKFLFYNSVSHDDSFKVGSVRACVATQTPHWLVQLTGVAA